MEYIHVRALELELDNLISEDEVSSLRILRRVRQLKDFEDRGSVEEGEVEFLETTEKELRRSIDNPFKANIRKSLQREQHPKEFGKSPRDRIVELGIFKEIIENAKREHAAINLALDKYENKFPKYVEWVQELVKHSVKAPAANDRAKEQMSLVEWMRWTSKTTFDALKTVLIDLGIQISKFLVDYLMLVRPVISERKAISVTLHEVKTLLRCQSVEENSVVINAFVSVVQLFDETLEKAAIRYDGKREGKEIDFRLKLKIEYGLLHLIALEVLRLEFQFSYPDMPMMVTNEWFLANQLIHYREYVFKNKLNNVRAKMNELKKELSNEGYDSAMKGHLHKLLDVGIQDIWYNIL
ncbi:hypothetical protein PanWU01x14_287330 [Parasponia andersonii]|uniref:Uncharacterized protein n=1 Tax=Parasponia andersonii TaxID=3476 RepID=A0A2P5AZ01_PARAD|nr:hypothetical protein PanWU01x14_287330 [Parasponia andersonii]